MSTTTLRDDSLRPSTTFCSEDLFTCDYCSKTFCKLSNLTRHKKTSLQCIKLQKEQGIENKQNNFKCDCCDKQFTLRHHLIRHLKTCKLFEIESLKKQIENIVTNTHSHNTTNTTATHSHNTTTNSHNTTNNTYNITISDRFKALEVFDIVGIKEEICRRITEDIIKTGVNNTANHVANSISPYVITTDLARQILMVKDKDMKPNKKDAIQLSSNVLKTCSEDFLNKCDKSLEKEMKKPSNTLFEMHNVKTRNNIFTVKSNIRDNQKDNVNDLSRKTAQYLSKKSYNNDNNDTLFEEEEVEEEENILRPIENDILYDGSDTD